MQKYNLKEMLEEIQRDEAVEKPAPKLLTQEEIQEMIRTRRKAATEEKQDGK